MKDLSIKQKKPIDLNHGFYLSYTDEFSPKFSATLGLRAEIIKDPVSDQNVFNPQFQTLYKFNDNTSWYVDIGRGFQMPTVDSYYGKKQHQIHSSRKKVGLMKRESNTILVKARV